MRFTIPISKFEKLEDGRMKIIGLASDETRDSQGDVLDYDGTKKAASFWRGNIREAHDPKKPVGKALNLTFDDKARTFGVEAFISSGAKDTQAKIEEGVLGSFSVGGSNPTKVRMTKIGGIPTRVIEEWQMTELSVVDAPANPNANFELVKADGVATELLAGEPESLEVATNRFAKAIRAELEKKAASAPLPGDATTVEGKKKAPGSGGPESAAAKKKPAETVEEDDAAPGTVDPNGNPAVGASAEEIVGSNPAPGTGAPQSGPITDPPAEGVEPAGAAPGTGGVQSSAILDTAEASENKKPAPGTAGADSLAPINPPAEDVEAAGAGTGKEPGTEGPGGDATEAGRTGAGADDASDMIDGTPPGDWKGTPKPQPKKKLSGKAAPADLAKAAARRLVTKYFFGGESQDIADAVRILEQLAMLYEAEAAEGEDESTQLDLLAQMIAAGQRFVALEGIELASAAPSSPGADKAAVDINAQSPPDTSIAYAAGSEGISKDDEGVAEAVGPTCTKCGGVMSCQKCAKAIDGGEIPAEGFDNIMPTTGKGALMPRLLKAVAANIAKRYAPTATAGGEVFKVNNGDELAEGIGKGLSLVNEEIAKANGELKESIGLEFKAVRESIEKLAKTAAVPTPLRSARVAEKSPIADTEGLARVRTLESALASIQNPEAAAELQRHLAVARVNAGLPA
jgi:hypothetical protein